MAARDSQRGRLYAAERDFLTSFPVLTEEQLKEMLKVFVKKTRRAYPKTFDRVNAALSRHHGYPAQSEIKLKFVKSDYRSCVAQVRMFHLDEQMTITLSTFGMNAGVLAHEFAHILSWYDCAAGHDWYFARTYLDVVRRCIGEHAYGELKAAFKSHRVSSRKPVKLSPEEKLARRERFVNNVLTRRGTSSQGVAS